MPKNRPALRCIELTISFLAGHLDATGFLIAKGFFVSFMSGNTTQIGVYLGDGWDAIFLPVALIAAFVAGVTSGAALAWSRKGKERSSVLALCLALLIVASVFYALGITLGFLLPVACAMGLINNVFIRDNDGAVGVTYITGALVRVGRNFAARMMNRPDDVTPGFGPMWLSLAIGAVFGAVVHDWHYLAGPVIAVVLCAALTAGARWSEAHTPGD